MTQPRHLKPQPTLSESLLGAMSGRQGKALAGMALAVPTGIATVGLSAPANAAPTSPAAVAPTAAAVTPVAAPVAPTAISLPTGYWAGGVYVLRYGDRNSYVKVLQKRLGISQDGSFGPATRNAVKSFQGRKGLSRDGIVGPNTWRALGGFSKSSGSSSSSAPSRGNSSVSSSSRVVQIAKRYLGTPYVYGGASTRGFDCSGLTSHVYRQVGVSLPRTARAQHAATKSVSSPRAGDLVFYGRYHVGIYIGAGKMIDSPKPGTRVQIRSVYTPLVSKYGRV
ncbi:NlpC/P60 family protein [Dermacoccaceae bacterium W4C1]